MPYKPRKQIDISLLEGKLAKVFNEMLEPYTTPTGKVSHAMVITLVKYMFDIITELMLDYIYGDIRKK